MFESYNLYDRIYIYIHCHENCTQKDVVDKFSGLYNNQFIAKTCRDLESDGYIWRWKYKNTYTLHILRERPLIKDLPRMTQHTIQVGLTEEQENAVRWYGDINHIWNTEDELCKLLILCVDTLVKNYKDAISKQEGNKNND